MSKKLYKVTCKGMTHRFPVGAIHGVCYVVAEDPTTAYLRVRADLDRRELGGRRDRELESIELVAEQSDYPECGVKLHAEES